MVTSGKVDRGSLARTGKDFARESGFADGVALHRIFPACADKNGGAFQHRRFLLISA